eukprot:gb/GFBE01028921.1/.p1 GENE.gb/GFBE01028921.1/~~gb/GFBE01028921.1/.p1  ORF type:complete len:483 (+),score=89.02 gb/GFBE01028921.1/:1-1449(+)
MAKGLTITSWSEWLTGLARAPSAAAAGAFSDELRFPTAEGLIVVREELPLQHARGTARRARCTTSGAEYDLRRLRVGAEEGGLVALEALEAVDREADLAGRAGSHPNVVCCHGVLVQNAGATHSRLLLCDPCTMDLASYMAELGSDLPVGEVADLGQQLAFGLGHLHSLGILCGGITPPGVLRGLRDGFWKLADFSRAAVLPVAASEWRDRCRARPQEAPPEARSHTDDAVKPEADVWLLAALLSALLCGAGSVGVPAVPPRRLTDPGVSRLWLLLHWLLAEGPECRPCAGESAALLGAVLHTPPLELLDEMPARQRRRCRGVALAAARQLAVDLAVEASSGGNRAWRLAELSLERLREELRDSSQVDLLLENCGFDPSSILEADDAGDHEAEGSEAEHCAAVRAVAAAEKKAVCQDVGVHSDISTNASSSSTSDEPPGLSSACSAGADSVTAFKSSCSELPEEAAASAVNSESADLLGLFT